MTLSTIDTRLQILGAMLIDYTNSGAQMVYIISILKKQKQSRFRWNWNVNLEEIL